MLVSGNEEFTDILWANVSTDPNQTEFVITTPVTANQQLWARVGFYSTSGNRSEYGVKFAGVSNPTELQTFVESFYNESGGDTEVTVSTTFANYQNIEIFVFNADGRNGSLSTASGGNGQFAVGGTGGSGGSGFTMIAKLSGEDIGWTSGQTFTFPKSRDASIYAVIFI